MSDCTFFGNEDVALGMIGARGCLYELNTHYHMNDDGLNNVSLEKLQTARSLED